MDNYWIALMVAAAALATTFGLAWGFRVRAVKRRLRALDAYADRELAQERGERARIRGAVGGDQRSWGYLSGSGSEPSVPINS
jgi:hypothetical protein